MHEIPVVSRTASFNAGSKLAAGVILACAPFLITAASQSELIPHVEERLRGSLRIEADSSPLLSRATVVEILAREDPATFFDRYVYGLKRNSEKLLRPEQRAALDKLLEKYEPQRRKWHDERNVLRCKFNEVTWHFAGADETEAKAIHQDLERWMELRSRWTLREQLLYHELNSAVWATLDARQRNAILRGEWKQHAKMTTGHRRENAAERSVTRALGASSNAAAFAKVSDDWKKERAELHRLQQQYEHTARRIGFAMDINDDALVRDAIHASNEAYARLYLAEARAIRRLVQEAYNHSESACAKAAAEAWSEAPQRFQAGAADLIALLTPHPSN